MNSGRVSRLYGQLSQFVYFSLVLREREETKAKYSAPQEMLEEWRPLMCPFDVTMAKAISYFEMFLPTFNSFDRRDTTFDLWFEELMAFWEACPNLPLFEPSLLTIFTRLADHTSGYLDWSKYIPKFLTR